MGDDRRTVLGSPAPLVLERPVLARETLVRLGLLALVLIAVYLGIDQLLLEEPPTLDLAVRDTVEQARTATAIAVAHGFTLAGDLWFVALAGVALVAGAYLRAGSWDAAWFTGLVVGGTLAVTAVIKAITFRPRPDEALAATISYAFPSGHASRAAAVGALIVWLALRWGRRPVVRTGLVVAGVVLAVGVGISRVLLGAHWTTDVLGGWVLGVAWLVGCVAVTRPRRADA